MDEVVLPSLSQLPSNCCMAEEIWAYLKHLKYNYRYELHVNIAEVLQQKCDFLAFSCCLWKGHSSKEIKQQQFLQEIELNII